MYGQPTSDGHGKHLGREADTLGASPAAESFFKLSLTVRKLPFSNTFQSAHTYLNVYSEIFPGDNKSLNTLAGQFRTSQMVVECFALQIDKGN